MLTHATLLNPPSSLPSHTQSHKDIEVGVGWGLIRKRKVSPGGGWQERVMGVGCGHSILHACRKLLEKRLRTPGKYQDVFEIWGTKSNWSQYHPHELSCLLDGLSPHAHACQWMEAGLALLDTCTGDSLCCPSAQFLAITKPVLLLMLFLMILLLVNNNNY